MLDHYERTSEDLGEAHVFSRGTASSTFEAVGATVEGYVDAQSVDAPEHIERMLKEFLAKHYPEHTYVREQTYRFRYRHGGIVWLSLFYYLDAEGYERAAANRARRA